jgi:hypothetical protein
VPFERVVRELVRVTRPGGSVVVTTPNHLSGLSLLTLVMKGQFSSKPISAGSRMNRESTRSRSRTRDGRVPLTGWHYHEAAAAIAPRRFSDTVAIIGRRCASRS